MNLPNVLQGNYVKEYKQDPPPKKVSNSLASFFTVCQLLFGFNFGFINSSGILKTAVCLMTCVSGCLMIVLLFLAVALDVVGSYTYLVYFFQYIPIVFVLHTAKYNLKDFLADLSEKNVKAVPNNGSNLGIYLWLYTSIMFGAKIATSIVYCSLKTCVGDDRWLLIDTVIHIPMIALDILPIANFIIFYHVYDRLKDLKMKYENRLIHLDALQNSYKQVADDFDKLRLKYDAIFFWGFITEASKWMVIIWNHLILIRYSSSWWLYACSYTWSSFITIQICVPAVFAEMVTAQTDAIKIILHEKLLVETDEEIAFEVTRLLRYVEARPLLRRAWRLVPLDLRLPVSMLSICTTYLIVIIQFSHIYD